MTGGGDRVSSSRVDEVVRARNRLFGGQVGSQVEVVQAAREFVDAYESYSHRAYCSDPALTAAYQRIRRALDELKRLEHSEDS